MHCSMFNSISGLFPLDVSSAHPLNCDNQKYLQTLLDVPCGACLPPFENPWFEIENLVKNLNSDAILCWQGVGVPKINWFCELTNISYFFIHVLHVSQGRYGQMYHYRVVFPKACSLNVLALLGVPTWPPANPLQKDSERILTENPEFLKLIWSQNTSTRYLLHCLLTSILWEKQFKDMIND